MTETHFSVEVQYNGGLNSLLPGQAVQIRSLKGKCHVQTIILSVVLSDGNVLCERDELNSLALIGTDWEQSPPLFKLRATQPVIGGRITINPANHPYGCFGYRSRATWKRENMSARAWSETTHSFGLAAQLPDMRVLVEDPKGDIQLWLPEQRRYGGFRTTHLMHTFEPAELAVSMTSLLGRSIENVPLYLAWLPDGSPNVEEACAAAEYWATQPWVYQTICPDIARMLRYALHPQDASQQCAA